jgi:hypothetical protein
MRFEDRSTENCDKIERLKYKVHIAKSKQAAIEHQQWVSSLPDHNHTSYGRFKARIWGNWIWFDSLLCGKWGEPIDIEMVMLLRIILGFITSCSISLLNVIKIQNDSCYLGLCMEVTIPRYMLFTRP